MSEKVYHVRGAEGSLIPISLTRHLHKLAVSVAEPAIPTHRERISDRLAPNAFSRRLELHGQKWTVFDLDASSSTEFDAIKDDLKSRAAVAGLQELYQLPGSDDLLVPSGKILVAPISSLKVTRKLRELDGQVTVAWGDVGIVEFPRSKCPFDICSELLNDLQAEVRFAEPSFGVLETRWLDKAPAQAPRDDVNYIVNAAPLKEGECGKLVVAVADDGIWLEHPALKGRVEWGFDFVEQTNSLLNQPARNDGHGTTCAGLIAGLDGDVFRGIAAGCHLACYRIGRSVRGTFVNFAMDRTVALASAIRDGWLRGARVMSISLAANVPSTAISEVIAEVSRNDPPGVASGTMVVVAAAGNRAGLPMAPASHPDVIPAAGAMPDGGGWKLADGPRFYSAAEPSFPVMAPAWELKAPTLEAFADSLYLHSASKTSVAAPIFAGAVARLLAIRPTAGVAEVRSALMAGANAVPNGPMKLLNVGAAEAEI